MHAILVALAGYWRRRTALRHLSAFDDRLLADMGFDRDHLAAQITQREKGTVRDEQEDTGPGQSPVRHQSSASRPLFRTACSAASMLANT